MEHTPHSLSTSDIYKITTVDLGYKNVYYFIGFDESGKEIWSKDGKDAKRFVVARDALDFTKTLNSPFGMDIYPTTSIYGDHL